MIKKCKVCGSPFKTYPCRSKGNGGHKALFCSKHCANKYNQNGKETRFKKGNIPPFVLHPENAPRSNNHFAWKGKKVSYTGLHQWVIREKGRPEFCEHCGVTGKYGFCFRMGKKRRRWNLDWANIDHEYNRNVNDFIGLCKSCHTIYDIKNNL